MVPAKLIIFISYVHEDSGIANALNNLINDSFGSDVTVFMDKVSIQQSENIRASIDENLTKADILAVVSTGIDGPRYWAGYEIGFFQAKHQGQRPPDRPLWGKVVNFCSSGNSPGPIAEQKHVALGFDSVELEKSEKDFGAELTIADDEAVLQWLGQLFTAVKGEKLEERRKAQDTLKANISVFWKAAFAEFKRRPKFEFKPQKQLKIRFRSVGEHRSQLGEDAVITLLGGAHTVFGVLSHSSSRSLKWREFCNELEKAESSLATFWTGTLLRILARAGVADNLDEVSGNLIWSQNEQKLYRVILTTYTTYYDGTIEASIYIVEVIRRPDHGDPYTTRLAKGLQSTMRFRSLFLEEKGLFNYLNIALGHGELAVVAADIVAELDFLNMELVASELDTPASWKDMLTSSEIEAMAQTWRPLNEKLLESCKKAIAANEPLAVESAKSQLASTLREIEAQVGPLNDNLLTAIASRLVDVAKHAPH